MLTNSKINRLKKPSKLERHLDSDGQVMPNGSKNWRYRYKNFSGSWTMKALGSYPQITIERARELRDDFKTVKDYQEVSFKQTAYEWLNFKGEACFENWLAGLQSSTHSQEEMQALSRVRAFIGQHGESHFADLNKSDDRRLKTIDHVGYRKGENETGIEYVYYILPEWFKTEVCKGISWKLAVNALKRHGYLKHQPDRNTHLTPETETGDRLPSYAVYSSILEST